MLNYIWLGLIVIAILVGVGYDIRDEVVNTYQNGQELTAEIAVMSLAGSAASAVSPDGVLPPGKYQGMLKISGRRFSEFYRLKSADTSLFLQPVALSISGGSAGSPSGQNTLIITLNDATPQFWRDMAQAAGTKTTLTGLLKSFRIGPAGMSLASFTLSPVSFVKMRKITQAAVDYAGTAVTISLGLIGIMALWIGIMKIAEEAGIIRFITKLVTPLTRRLFPDVPSDHPAIGAMIMNISANMLGLSNAATPLGLKAMEDLDTLNQKKGVATNAMVTFLAINTAGLTFIPATAIAIRVSLGSASPTVIVGTSIIGAACATVAGITAAKLLEKLPVYRRALELDPPKDSGSTDRKGA